MTKLLQLLGNSSDLNPMENAWNHMKNKVQDVQLSNIGELQAALKDSCVHMQMVHFLKLADLMSTWLHKVLKTLQCNNKYVS